MALELIIDKLYAKIVKGVLKLEYIPPFIDGGKPNYRITHNGVHVGSIKCLFGKYILTIDDTEYDLDDIEYRLIASLYMNKIKEPDTIKTLSFLDSLGG